MGVRLLVDRRCEGVGVELGHRRHREDTAGVGVEDDGGAGEAAMLIGAPLFELRAEIFLEALLEFPIDRRHQRVAGDGVERFEFAHGDARCVHLDLLAAGSPVQPAVVDVLEAVFAGDVVG
jgi:hypothetical protein